MKRVGKQPVWQLLVVTTDVCGPFYRIVHFNVRRSCEGNKVHGMKCEVKGSNSLMAQ